MSDPKLQTVKSPSALDEALFRAAYYCDPVAMREALAAHANPNARFLPLEGASIAAYDTPLHCLMGTGHGNLAQMRECTTLLLQAGADMNAPDAEKNLPTHRTLTNGHFNQAGLVTLLEAGADANGRGKHGWTPLHYAMEHETPHAARILLAAGAKKEVWSYGSEDIWRSDSKKCKAVTPQIVAWERQNDVMEAFIKKELAHPSQALSDRAYMKQTYGFDLAKRKVALNQQELDNAAAYGPLADVIKHAPKPLCSRHSIHYSGKLTEWQIATANAAFRN